MTFPHILSGAGVGDKLLSGAGSGITGAGTVHKTRVTRDGDLLKTEMLIDLTDLDVNAVGDIIGATGAANCHLGQISLNQCGTIIAGRVTCLEAPAGGDADIDLYSATEATGAEDAAITSLTERELSDAGAHTLGGVDILSAFPAAGEYLSLVAGAGATVFAPYTAGKLLIELWGTR